MGRGIDFISSPSLSQVRWKENTLPLKSIIYTKKIEYKKNKMDNEIALALVIHNALAPLPPFVLHVEYDENQDIDDMLVDQRQYQSLLHMGFNPVDETGDMTPIIDMGFQGPFERDEYVMDRQTILYEFEQLHNGVGNQVLQEFLNQNGRLVLISKYYETYVYQPNR